MPKIKIAKETAVDDWGLPRCGSHDVLIVSDDIIDQSRWSLIHELIIKADNKYYRTYYSVGSTECQDEEPWEYEDEVVLEEVYPEQVLTTVFMPVKD